jgi:hypothetical protein
MMRYDMISVCLESDLGYWDGEIGNWGKGIAAWLGLLACYE